VALIDALGEWMSQPPYFSRYGQEAPRRTGARHPSIAPYGPHEAGDGTSFLGIQNDELTAILEASFAGLRADQVSELLDQAGIASARLRTPEEFTRHRNCAPAAAGAPSARPAETSTRSSRQSR
jgi:crotonobetainyl-CoA:carnitine CoA-transferase CaiB-like acyl-CoA transferase